ncbi:MAG TPA: DUF1918 domain-containing protein [Streptosporangiaceae bacterium]|nr:DUF1918 domain-containing protein [Streptosporangiaceae bacterium]
MDQAHEVGGEVRAVRAQVGDLIEVGHGRTGVVIGVPSLDGAPPYIVKWTGDGHIAMVTPDQYARVIPARPRRECGREREENDGHA